MKPSSWRNISAAIIMVLPLIYLAAVYYSFPAIIPVHFNLYGRADKFGDRSELIFVCVLLSIVGAGSYLLLTKLPLIDPKKKVSMSMDALYKIAFCVLCFVAILNMAIIYATSHQGLDFNIGRLIFPLCGLFFAFLGNQMHNIKPNYFAGIRTPWTLENEDNWRATHRLGGKLFFFGGLAIALLTLIVPARVALFVFLPLTTLIAIIPCVYSYLYFKKHRAS